MCAAGNRVDKGIYVHTLYAYDTLHSSCALHWYNAKGRNANRQLCLLSGMMPVDMTSVHFQYSITWIGLMYTRMKNIVKGCRDGCQQLHVHVGVGMAVCRQDTLYKDYTSNPIPTSFLNLTSFCGLCYETTGQSTLKQKMM